MTESGQEDREVLQFIHDKIDSVPHMEALLLLWNSRPNPWTAEGLGARLYVEPNAAQKFLEDLVRSGLIVSQPGRYFYKSQSPDQDRLMDLVDATYRQQLVRVSSIIHSKVPSSVRDFARAFRFKKEPE